MPKTNSDSLKDEIEKVSKEIAHHQAKVDEHAKFFETIQMRLPTREELEQSGHGARYDEMVYSERKLSQAQQKLNSLLLESLSRSSDKLGRSVGILNSSTKGLLRLSRILEYLTRQLIALTLLIAIQPLVIQLAGVWGLLAVAIAFMVVAFLLTRFSRKAEGLDFPD